MSGADPVAVAAARLAIAAVILLAISAVRRTGRSERANGRERVVLALAGATLALHFASWIASLDYTSIAVSTLLVATTPLWTAGYDAIVHRRLLAASSLAASVSGAIGLALVVGFDRTAAPQPGHEWLGAALALLGAIGIAAYLLLVRSVRRRLGTRTIVTHTYTWAALFLVAAAAAVHQTPPPLANSVAWGGIVAMALVSQLLGHTAMNASLRWFTPSAIGFSTLLEPVVAAALGLVIFREALPPVALAGAALLLGSVAVVIRNEREPQAEPLL